jgi:hypothetical protein
MWSTWNYGGDNRQIFDVNIVYYLYIHISSKLMNGVLGFWGFGVN